VAGRSGVDSRPFQIFEGSNDVLYQQISESVLKSMRQMKEKKLADFLEDHDLTSRATEYFDGAFDFKVDQSLPQRKLVELGRALGRVVTMDMIIELGDRGFRSDLISNGLNVFRKKVDGLLTTYHRSGSASVITACSSASARLTPSFLPPRRWFSYCVFRVTYFFDRRFSAIRNTQYTPTE
jgi:hypothetical protein